MGMRNQFVSFKRLHATASKCGEKFFSNEDKDFQVLMNKSGSNALGFKMSCDWFHAHLMHIF